MKNTATVFFILGTITFLSNLLNIKAITQARFVLNFANATGGLPSDILGGFGSIFYFFSFIFFYLVYKKVKASAYKWLLILSLVLGVANFYFAFSSVL